MKKRGRPLREDAVRITHELHERTGGELSLSELAILVSAKLGEEVHRKTVSRWLYHWRVTAKGIEKQPLHPVAQSV